jgi:regulator of replication initiation timing
LHEAVKGFEKGVGVFSEEIKAIVQKVNSILAAQAEQALKNAELRKLLADPSPTATTIAVSANKPAEGG